MDGHEPTGRTRRELEPIYRGHDNHRRGILGRARAVQAARGESGLQPARKRRLRGQSKTEEQIGYAEEEYGYAEDPEAEYGCAEDPDNEHMDNPFEGIEEPEEEESVDQTEWKYWSTWKK